MMVKIGNKKIGDNNKVYIVFEAGPTHGGFKNAKKLIIESAKYGADAIKFQILDPDLLIKDKSQLINYKILNSKNQLVNKSSTLYSLLKDRQLTFNEWKELKKICDDNGIAFFATAAFEKEIDFLHNINCDSIKIASADMNHLPLIEYAANTGLCIQIDSGMASLAEIENAVNLIESCNNKKIIIHQCPSGYPAYLESINLNMIKTLKRMFDYPIAFSDHTPGATMDIAAISLGVNLIEKTITLNRKTKSIEHVMSIEPKDMQSFIETLRNVEIAMGKYRRKLSSVEKNNRDKLRRTAYYGENYKPNTKLKDISIIYMRPGEGVTPDQIYQYKKNKKVKLIKTVKKFEQIKFDHFK